MRVPDTIEEARMVGLSAPPKKGLKVTVSFGKGLHIEKGNSR